MFLARIDREKHFAMNGDAFRDFPMLGVGLFLKIRPLYIDYSGKQIEYDSLSEPIDSDFLSHYRDLMNMHRNITFLQNIRYVLDYSGNKLNFF
jgi:hypothetical protein